MMGDAPAPLGGTRAASWERPLEGELTEQIGGAFQMLLRIRMFIAAVTLSLVPLKVEYLDVFLLVLTVALLSWLAGRCWRYVAPRLARHPLLFALDMAASFTVLGLGGTSGPYLLATVVTATLAGLLYHWRGMLTVAGLQTLCYYVTFASTTDSAQTPTFQDVLGQPLCYPLAGFAGVALRRLLDANAEQAEARRSAEVKAAAAEERARLAREMHDSLAKTLRGIALAATGLRVWVERDRDRALDEADRIATACQVASREARSLLSELRRDTVPCSLSQVVAETARDWSESAGVPVDCDIAPDIDLPLRVRHEAVAILSEALTNVERHAGAGSVRVRLDRGNGELRLTVRDDGAGFHPPELTTLARQGHYGLIGLHERARRVGGVVKILSTRGDGTTVLVRLPMDERAHRLAEVS
ncbi:sensor histidine kinase [Actinomadura citrea]|uniref:sensor histidine kinase n=1 Tax=Actinomadura citrea TaxID=46158 RepID=UPI003CE55ED3